MSDKKPSAVHLLAFEHPGLANALRGRLLKRKQELTEALAYAQDWADFRCRKGALDGLDEAVAICQELERQYGDN